MKKNKSVEKEIDINNNHFALVIAKLREESGLNQKDFSELLGVSYQTISKWENGKSVPDGHTLQFICEEFDISPTELLMGKTTFKTYLRKIKRFLKKIIDYILDHMLSIIVLITLILLSLFFINNYKAVSVYEVKHTNEDILIEYGYFIKSKHRFFLTLDDIKVKTLYEINDAHIELYVIARGDKHTLYESNNLENIYIEEINGYTEKLNRDVINAITKELYLSITFIDENNIQREYSTKIDFNKRFSSDKIMYHYYQSSNINNYLNYDNIASKYNLEIKPAYNLFVDTSKPKLSIENKLSDLGYEYDKETEEYINTNSNEVINFYNNYFMYHKFEGNKKFNLIYYIDKNKIEYKIYGNDNIEIMKLEYYIKDGSINCMTGDCENYLDDIDYILSIYEQLK